jgi:thymidylate synthase (FAD)
MSEITYRSDFDTEYLYGSGGDAEVVMAARVSTKGRNEQPTDPTEARGLINFLIANRHGTPFEHNSLTYFVSAPIFVFREFHRHRIGFSYNEESGRYKQLDPVFYIPGPDRPLVQQGKPGHYIFVPGLPEQHQLMVSQLKTVHRTAYGAYESMMAFGVAKEVSRTALPVGIYSSMYVTCNARSLMSFLSLRTKHEDSKFPSYPQWEIEQVALGMEAAFREKFPVTWEAFQRNGRVSP